LLPTRVFVYPVVLKFQSNGQILFKDKRWFTAEQFLVCHDNNRTEMQAAIAYYRVSTERQGKSGLGLEAQQKAVNSFAVANGFILIDEFIEIQSAKRKTRRLALILALEECRKEGAVLLIAKLDRLSRSVAFISTLQ
jgi:hypothetical protein